MANRKQQKIKQTRIPAPTFQVSRPRRKLRSNRMSNNNMSGPQTPLLPQSVNNRMTVPRNAKTLSFKGSEYAGQPISLNGTTADGIIIFNTVITPKICPRLAAQSRCWQRWKIKHLKGRLVTLTGSTVQSGYTMAFIDDPSFTIRTDRSGIVNLTSFAGSTIRQNWVMSEVASNTRNGDRPPLFVEQSGEPRLYSPGRVVVQLNGVPVVPDAGTATWALMLDYEVEFSVPGVEAEPDDAENFYPSWSNDQDIGIQPTGPGLDSIASSQGLQPHVAYYIRNPVPVALVVGGNNTIAWCIGFMAGIDPTNWNLNYGIRSTDPLDPTLDTQGITPVSGLGENLFFRGTGFATSRPSYIRPS